MKRSTGGMVGGLAALVLGMWFVSQASAADEVPKEIADGIKKIADLLEKGKTDDAKKAAADLAKKAKCDGLVQGSCEELMHVFAPRGKKGFGVGDKPGMIKPDGMEQFIQDLGDDKKKMPEKTLKAQAAELKKMALITLAVAEVTIAATPAKDAPKKPKADWKKFADEMKDYSTKLADALDKGDKLDVKAVKLASKNLDGSCTGCHQVFKK
ncbi:MAG: cytochrome c [Gemmataceae bacterium]|nr:cytochrome c [Gemmataceae bacterium]